MTKCNLDCANCKLPVHKCRGGPAGYYKTPHTVVGYVMHNPGGKRDAAACGVHQARKYHKIKKEK